MIETPSDLGYLLWERYCNCTTTHGEMRHTNEVRLDYTCQKIVKS